LAKRPGLNDSASKRLELPHAQQHGNAGCLWGFFQPLANFEATVAWHVDIEDDEVGLRFSDLFEGSRAIIDSNNLVAGIAQDPAAHVLGCHTVVS